MHLKKLKAAVIGVAAVVSACIALTQAAAAVTEPPGGGGNAGYCSLQVPKPFVRAGRITGTCYGDGTVYIRVACRFGTNPLAPLYPVGWYARPMSYAVPFQCPQGSVGTAVNYQLN